MKLATWNVNGIRAREAQVLELVHRERPDVLCLQEIKAPPARVPATLCELEGYWCLWHGETAYSGVGLHVRRELAPARPIFVHPPFDMETRIVTVDVAGTTFASVYVPNGGKDFAAKLRFLEALERWAAEAAAAGRTLVVAGDLNVARTDQDVHAKERKPGHRRAASGRARAPRGNARPRARGRRTGRGSGERRPVHLLGAVAEPAPAQHRLAHRLRARVRAARRPDPALRRPRRLRDERSRAGGRRVRLTHRARGAPPVAPLPHQGAASCRGSS